MIAKQYRCRNCGERFKADIFEKGEAEAKRLPSGPVHCPSCNRTDIYEDK